MKTLGLYECEITGNEFGDTKKLVAVSTFKDNLISYSKYTYGDYPVELDSLNSPPIGTKSPYYIIDKTHINIC